MHLSTDTRPFDRLLVGSVVPSYVFKIFLSYGTVDGAVNGPSTHLWSIDGESLIPHPPTRPNLFGYILKVFELFSYPPLHIHKRFPSLYPLIFPRFITHYLPITPQIPTLPLNPHKKFSLPKSPIFFNSFTGRCSWWFLLFFNY